MNKYIREYYDGVLKSIGLSFLIALFAIVTAFVLQLCFRAPLPLGAAAALFLMGLIWIISALLEYHKYRINKRQALRLAESEADKYVARERGLITDLLVYYNKERQMYLIIFIIGFAFAILGAFGPIGPFACGAGAAISLMAGLGLVFCLFDEYRTLFYRDKLEKFAAYGEKE